MVVTVICGALATMATMKICRRWTMTPVATLTFDLGDEENGHYETLAFKTAIMANDMQMVLWDLDQWLRKEVKWAGDDVSDDTVNAYDKAREVLWDFMEEHGVKIILE
jgi:hypothetical protein